MGFQRAVQFIQHDAGPDDAAPVFHVEFEDAVEILGVVQHQRGVHRLPALGGAAAAGEDRNTLCRRDLDGGLYVLFVLRGQNAERHHLVERRVGRVAAPGKVIEQKVAGHPLAKNVGKLRHGRSCPIE